MDPRANLLARAPDVGELALGCSQLGNLYREVSDEDAQATLDTAWELGVRYFDTAPHYGLGLSERRVGAGLAARPRDAYVLSTKVGRVLEPVEVVEGLDEDGFVVPATHRRVWDFSRDGIRRSLSESLERLAVDRVDIVYLHDPDDHWNEVIETGYPALAELRAEGAVAAVGAGMNQSQMLADLVRQTDVDVVMLAGRYTLLEQDSLDDLLPLCEERNVAIVVAGVFNTGLLARPHPSEDARYNYAGAPPELVRARACDRGGLRAARHDAAGGGDRLPARAPGGRQRVRRRALPRAGGAERGPLPRADRAGPVERAEGGRAPPRGRTGAHVTVEWWYDDDPEVFT